MAKLIKATANKSKRIFTLRCYDEGYLYAIYRTYPMSKEEFEDSEYNTENDWWNFLKSEGYYEVRR